jgi:hypothetical protein
MGRPGGGHAERLLWRGSPTKSIAVPDTVDDRVQEAAAAEGTTVEQFAASALERDLARRWLDCIGREPATQ